MIPSTDKYKCCGCGACVQVCPKECLRMHPDAEGFLYPKKPGTNCNDCGLCEKVCPFCMDTKVSVPKYVYAAKNKNIDIQVKSSSGGVFNTLAESILMRGGVVFGARFNENWEVIHDSAETMEEIKFFRGSKYVQSDINDSFIRARRFLKQGREVLFSGTPCQILGLKLFLGKEYENLTTVDLICHSVPSAKVFSFYLNKITEKKNIKAINFRMKKPSWDDYSLSVVTTDGEFISRGKTDVYMKGFLMSDLITRPACSKCPAKEGRSGSDITLADFWGIKHCFPDFYDNRGVSAVLINSSKAHDFFKNDDLILRPARYEQVVRFNPSLIRQCRKNPRKEMFFSGLNEENVIELLRNYTRRPLKIRLKRFIWKIFVFLYLKK